MTFDRSDFAGLIEKRKQERVGDQKTSLEMIQRAAVTAESLTGDANWDTFLSYIQDAIERTNSHIATFEAALRDPEITNIDDIMRAKIKLAVCSGRLEAMESIRSLPKDLMDSGKEARKLLATLPKNHDQPQ